MKNVLIIEDDEKTASLYEQQLGAKGFSVEVARNGREGLQSATSKNPSVVILDLLLPELSGLDVLKGIRAHANSRHTPVVVLSKADAKSIVSQARAAGATEVLTKSACVPRRVVDVICELAGGNGAASAGSDDDFENELRRSCLESGPSWVQDLRTSFQTFSNDTSKVDVLKELHRHVHSMAGNAGLSGLRAIHAVGSLLESLVEEMRQRPDSVTASVTRTVAQAIDLLDQLFRAPIPPEQDVVPRGEVLAVDDQDIALRAVTHSMQKAKLTAIAVNDPVAALAKAEEKEFDLVITDIDMPGLSGIDFCTKLRALPSYAKTPVLFVTNAASFENRVKANLSGGTELIAKPYLFHELAVKALAVLVQSRIRKP